MRKKLLTASDLATLCEVDLKTIHNWVDRGRISHFRTPGRHLRFRAADVADFLRTWGYSVPRELSKESARAVMVVGLPEALALVTRALGENAPAGKIPPPSPSGVGLSPPSRRVGAPSEPPAANTAGAETRAAPLRHYVHPYDALIEAGADPADIYVVELAPFARETVDPMAFLEALRRASPRAAFVGISGGETELPPFALRVGRNDVQALEAILAPEGAAAPEQAAPASELPLGLVAGGSSR